MRRPQNFAKSSPYFCPMDCQRQGKILQNFVAFSEYMNFTIKSLHKIMTQNINGQIQINTGVVN